MLLADGARYLTDPADIQAFDTLRHKIEAARRTQQHSDLTHAMARQREKPVGDRMRVRE